MRKLGEVCRVISGKSLKKDTDGLWIKAIGEFEILSGKPDKVNLDHFICLVPGKEVLPEYLFHILQRPIENLSKEDSGKVIKKLTLVSVKNIEIPVPSLEDQEKILKSKNITRRIQKLWLENGIRSYDEPLKVDMSFDELLKILSQPKD